MTEPSYWYQGDEGNDPTWELEPIIRSMRVAFDRGFAFKLEYKPSENRDVGMVMHYEEYCPVPMRVKG